MGLSGFLSFLRKKTPQVFHDEHISLYAFERVFIDISGYMYRYICTHGKENQRWISAILQLLSTFRENKVIPIPVFDGKPPQEKQEEIKDRKDKRDLLSSRITNLNTALQDYLNDKQTCSIDSIKILQYELERLEQRGQRLVSLLSKPNNDRITSKDIELLQQTLHTLQRQHIVIKEEDIVLLKQVLDSFGITWLQSPSESESYCAFLIREQMGTAMVSCDSDSLAHLTPELILNVDMSGGIVRIELEELLEALQITSSQLIDYAILMGCDYNKHMKSNKLGPVNALKLIQQYHRIEEIPEEMIDKECLSYARCRELFQPRFESVILEYKPPQLDKIQLFSKKWNLSNRLIQSFIGAMPISYYMI
jgi:5'-3' exonuclease